MGLISLIKKIKLGITRSNERDIDFIATKKQYGNSGENDFFDKIYAKLPSCKIKKKVIITSPKGDAEIDCLILYKNKLFAIEIKNLKGNIVEKNGKFKQIRYDRQRRITHIKEFKDPFWQIKRAVHLLRNQFPENVWVTPVVFFENGNKVELNTKTNDNIWFNDIDKLYYFITKEGYSTNENLATSFFKKCLAADCLWKGQDQVLDCVILDETLKFKIDNSLITKDDINQITIKHSWSYDELFITLKNGSIQQCKANNKKIRVIANGIHRDYSLSKIDYIIIGREIVKI